MSTVDWDAFIQNGLLVTNDDVLDRSSFELAMRLQLAITLKGIICCSLSTLLLDLPTHL